MKKTQVNAILINQAKRKRAILSYVLIIVILFVLSFSLCAIYYVKGKGFLVSYKEKRYRL